ncbi:MAG: type II secretion system protein GspN [Desulfatiglandales bacterium]
MKQFISRHKRWLGYISYCIIVTAALLYYRFPSDALRDYIQTRANNLNTRVLLSIEGIKPWPPFGLRFAQTEISLKDKPAIKIFGTDSLLVSPEAWSFFRGKSTYSFHCPVYGGDVGGRIHFEENRLAAPFSTEIELKNIRIGTYGYLKDLIGRDVDGILSGIIYYSGQQKDLIGGTGEANLKLLDGRIELLFPILELESIDFNEIRIDMVLKKQQVNLTRLELEGSQFKSTLSGSIGLKRDLAKSTLDLRGRIEPFASFFKNAKGLSNTVRLFKRGLRRGSLSFIIHGTIAEPKIKFT